MTRMFYILVCSWHDASTITGCLHFIMQLHMAYRAAVTAEYGRCHASDMQNFDVKHNYRGTHALKRVRDYVDHEVYNFEGLVSALQDVTPEEIRYKLGLYAGFTEVGDVMASVDILINGLLYVSNIM